MAVRSIKPDRTNREESVSALWRRLGIEEAAARPLQSTLAALDRYVDAGKAAQAGMCAMDVSRLSLLRWLHERWEHQDQSLDLQSAFAYFYWGEELYLHQWQADGLDYDRHDDVLHELLSWQGLAAACGEAWFAHWIAPHLHNLFASGNVAKMGGEFVVDKAARLFTQQLQSILISGVWPSVIDTEGLGAYAPLIATASDPAGFKAALIDFCDYRVAQCFGYNGIDATKRRRPSEDGSIMDRGTWEQVLPVELFTLKLAYETSTHQVMDLNADHPLLHTALMQRPFPPLKPLLEDALTKRLSDLGQAVYKKEWTLLKPAPSLFLDAERK
ncbi:MAG: hypothetical protein QM742_11990 [Aquabacterium sp.]